MAADPNRQMFEWGVNLLRPLLGELVFVGGCTTGLLITDSAASGIRPTNDVDAMPVGEEVLGFSNRWYPAAIRSAQRLSIAGSDIQLVTAVYFVATKLEAFRGRGAGDVTLSHDLEDIVAVIDGRPEIVEEIAQAASEARMFIASELSTLMANVEFREALSGFLLPDAASQARRRLLEEAPPSDCGAILTHLGIYLDGVGQRLTG